MIDTPKSPPSRPVFDTPGSNFSGKLIVAVHGMGDQLRNDFAQNIAHLMMHHLARVHKVEYQTTTLPVGAWDSGRETHVDDHAVRFRSSSETGMAIENYAYAEVYWADIARSMEVEGHRIEEPTHWARTVVERIAQRYGGVGGLSPESLHLAGFVIEEIGETLALLKKFAALGKLGKLSEAYVDSLLLKFLCDVQQVGDFARQREKIRLRFFNRLQWLWEQYPEAEIHLVAHSEGAAVCLYTLLSALNEDFCASAKKASKEAAERLAASGQASYPLTFDWIQQVRSFTTLGAPIDKHIILWPEMWAAFHPNTRWVQLPKGKIRWRNYYDYADPVGYELDTAREKLVEHKDPVTDKIVASEWGCNAFDFPKSGDHGFRRYPLSGKAHVDYFGDYELFSYIAADSVDQCVTEPFPGSRWYGYLSRVVPFLVVVLLMIAAVFVFHRGLVGDLPADPQTSAESQASGSVATPQKPSEAKNRTYRFSQDILNVSPETIHGTGESTKGIFGCAALLLGTTVFARILRLSNNLGMCILAFFIYVVGVAIFWSIPGYFTLEAAYLGGVKWFAAKFPFETPIAVLCRVEFVGMSLILVIVGWCSDYYACLKRWRPIWGLRILIIVGSLILFGTLVCPRLGDGGNNSAIALIGGWSAFVGLWWLACLFFDLSFCWERYINVEKSWLTVLRQKERQISSP